MCAGFHVRRAPCLPGSICYEFSCAGFLCLGFHVCWVPCMLGFMHAGFQAFRVPFTPSSCAKGSTCDEFQPHRVPFMPDPNHAGSVCYEFLCVLFLCVVNSMHPGFHACRIPCMPDSMCYEFLCVGLCSGFHLL